MISRCYDPFLQYIAWRMLQFLLLEHGLQTKQETSLSPVYVYIDCSSPSEKTTRNWAASLVPGYTVIAQDLLG